MRFGNQPHRRGACTGALKLTALARQWYADADVDVKRAGLSLELLDLARGCLTRRVASQPLLAA
jgi:hypothetical protein